MTWELTTLQNAPVPTRRKRSTILKLKEWEQTVSHLVDHGLKPYETIVVKFSADEREDHGIKNLGMAFKRELLKVLAITKLKYDVTRFMSGEDEIVRIVNPGALSRPELAQTPFRVSATGKKLGRPVGRPAKVHAFKRKAA